MSTVHIVFGPQGAGKSTYAKQLAESENAIHLSIDEWMWELYGPDLPKPMNLKWIMDRVARCEKRIWTTAKQVSLCGTNVILDLGFMKVRNRTAYLDLAAATGTQTQLHFVDAPYSIRYKRVMERNTQKGETFAFEVTPTMFGFMEHEFERPTEAELQHAVIIDTAES